MTYRRSFFLLLSLLFFKAIILAVVLSYAGIGLGPDEAQYWTWSQELDFGYYSKPPGIAWQIFAGTSLFGNNVFAVRAFSYLFAFATALAIWWLARLCHCQPKTSLFAALAFAFSPLGVLASFLAITDGGLVLFWALACCFFVRALQEPSKNLLLVGGMIALGALFKWPIYLFWLPVLLSLPFFTQLRCRALFWGLLISFLGLLPVLYWNQQHDFATFRHVLATLLGHKHAGAVTQVSRPNPLDFFLSQVALIFPFFAALLFMGWVWVVRNRRKVEGALLFCAALPLLFLLPYQFLAFFQKIQGNWVDFAYPSAFVFLAWYGCEAKGRWKPLLTVGVPLSALCSLALLHVPYLQAPYALNLFRHNVGWERLPDSVQNPGEAFLFSDKYQMSSILSFYNKQKRRAYFLNLHGARKNQFSYWPSLADEQVGKDGFFVLVENAPNLEQKLREKFVDSKEQLAPYFSEVEFLGIFPLFEVKGERVKAALVFYCREYNGKHPVAPLHY